MSVPNEGVRIGYNVVFYPNRNSLVVDRTIEFDPELPPPSEWWEPDEVIAADQIDAYQALCKMAVGLTTRLIYLPREANFGRALLHNNIYRPTGSFMSICGTNFKSDFHLGSQDFAKDGLNHHGTHKPYLQVGNSAWGGMYINTEGRYYNFDLGPNVCLVNRGREYPTRVASYTVVDALIQNLMVPLEGDIEARAYEWTGDSKTIAALPERVV